MNGQKKRLFARLVVSSAALLFGNDARALQTTVAFDGIISMSGSFSDPTGNFDPGDPISGFWTLDTATADADADPSRGEYPQSGTPAFQINIGAHTFSTNTTTIQILNDHTLGIGTIDAYDVLSAPASSTVPGLQVNQMQITLRDTAIPLDALSSDALPTIAPNPGSFDQIGQAAGQITGAIVGGGEFFMNLEIRSTELIVPEPGGLALFVLAMSTLAACCRPRVRARRTSSIQQ